MKQGSLIVYIIDFAALRSISPTPRSSIANGDVRTEMHCATIAANCEGFLPCGCLFATFYGLVGFCNASLGNGLDELEKERWC